MYINSFKPYLHPTSVALMLIALVCTSACASIRTTSSEQLSPFIDVMVEQYQFDRESLTALLQQGTVQESILDAMSRPAEKRLSWHRYRNIFLTNSRIEGGIDFWNQHQTVLQRAEDQYGVPAEIIVAIIGVETRYGGNSGSYRVLDALVTLGFHFPKRAEFFKKELQEYLLLCREEGLDPLALKGSYAGAMGWSQFIASSYRHYAVDGDQDGKRDLWNSPDDIIFSIANYFSQHGWKSGEPISSPATVEGDQYQSVLTSGLKPTLSVAEILQKQVHTDDSLPADAPAKLLELEQPETMEYWLALHNFYVITRYNHSHLYAMAVYQLSQAIKQGRMVTQAS